MIKPEVDKNTEKLELSNIASRNGEWHKNVKKVFQFLMKFTFTSIQ